MIMFGKYITRKYIQVILQNFERYLYVSIYKCTNDVSIFI